MIYNLLQMLYERDYRILTSDEKERWAEAEKIMQNLEDDGISPLELLKYYEMMPKAALHYKELFPNNYLDIDELEDKIQLENASEELLNLLNSKCNERDILNYIRDTKYYFIAGSIFQYGAIHFTFGHHEAFLFKEFPLGTNYITDFLLIGKNSGGYEFIFVEMESPQGLITLKDGEFGDVIRKGISQVKDWNRWLEANYTSLSSEFEKHLGNYKKSLPKEFYKLDKSRLHYVVIAGRREDFTEKTYSLKRELHRDNNITLMHYDNLIDCIKTLIASGNY